MVPAIFPQKAKIGLPHASGPWPLQHHPSGLLAALQDVPAGG